MHEGFAPSPLLGWESFYVIVGSSAAALTGLQFVVVTLITDLRRRSSGGEIGAFATPTVVHFSAVLWISAVLSAPWQGLASPAFVLAASGVVGAGYAGLVFRRARRQTGYVPVLEDWLWHTAFPFAAYATLVGAAPSLVRHPTGALFTIGAVALMLLFVGIHNAWDAVTYLAMQHLQSAPAAEQRHEPPRE